MLSIFKKKFNLKNSKNLVSVVDGDIIDISSVDDEVFAQKLLGEGVAIVPTSNYVVAPCDGEVTMIYPYLHAIGLKREDGLEILIHIGINTATLRGQGFKSFIRKSQIINKGDKLMEVDLAYIKSKKLDTTTMMLFPNKKVKFNIKTKGFAVGGSTIVAQYTNVEI